MNARVWTSAAVLLAAGAAHGQIGVTPTNNAALLANALQVDSAVSITSIAVNGHVVGGAFSTGLYTVVGANNYQLERGGVVLSTGDVRNYSSGPNTTGDRSFNYQSGSSEVVSAPGVAASAAQEALLDPITGGGFEHFDATQIDIQFVVNPGFDTFGFDVVFGSDEWQEFVNSNFIDGFGMFHNGVNIAISSGLPININHPGMANRPETELDGVLLGPGVFGPTPVLRFSGAPTPGVNTLTFIVADTSDGIYDTTVYISGLGIPAPGTAVALGAGLSAVVRRRRR